MYIKITNISKNNVVLDQYTILPMSSKLIDTRNIDSKMQKRIKTLSSVNIIKVFYQQDIPDVNKVKNIPINEPQVEKIELKEEPEVKPVSTKRKRTKKE